MRKIKYPRQFHEYVASEVEQLTPTVMRVVALPRSGARTVIESRGGAAETVRVVIPDGETGRIPSPEYRGSSPYWLKPAPPAKKYTIRRYFPETGGIEINLMIHEVGPGTEWSRRVRVGDPVYLLSPQEGLDISRDMGFYLMVGDETGWPGIARWIESLPDDAQGLAVIDVESADSEQTVKAPVGVRVVWVARRGDVMGEVLSAAEALGGYDPKDIFVWLAGESTVIRPVREWVQRELGVQKENLYAKGYWTRKKGAKAGMGAGSGALTESVKRDKKKLKGKKKKKLEKKQDKKK